MFIAVSAQAYTYNQVQHGPGVIKKSTTTFTNTWELRGNIELGVDTYTVTLDNVQKNVVLLGTGTVRAARVEGTTITGNFTGTLGATVMCSSVAANTVGIPQIKATGTPSASTVLAGDGSWKAAGVGDVVLASTQTFTGENTFRGNTYGVIPTGTIITYVSSSAIPTGYLYCNGQAVSTTTYSALFAVIGYTFGGTTTMNLPDMRGMFLRGLDNGRGYDPDSNRVVGSTQTDTMQGHFHASSMNRTDLNSVSTLPPGGNSNAQAGTMVGAPTTDGTNGTPRTGLETRPENIAVVYLIKY